MKKLVLLLLIALTFGMAIPSVGSARPVIVRRHVVVERPFVVRRSIVVRHPIIVERPFVVRRPFVVASPFVVDPFFPFFSLNFGFVVR